MKNRLRKELKQARAAKPIQEVSEHSNLLTKHIVTLLQTTKPCIVALYYPHAGEPDLLSLIRRPELDKFEWAFPVCSSDQNRKVLRFARFRGFDAFEMGDYGIPIPSDPTWLQPDWVLIPSLALNRSGFRLGYGAGWYDRTLSHLETKGLYPVTVGVAWNEAVIGNQFQESHDYPLDYVVSPFETIKIKSPT